MLPSIPRGIEGRGGLVAGLTDLGGELGAGLTACFLASAQLYLSPLTLRPKSLSACSSFLRTPCKSFFVKRLSLYGESVAFFPAGVFAILFVSFSLLYHFAAGRAKHGAVVEAEYQAVLWRDLMN